MLVPASISRGRIKGRGGKYKALIDGRSVYEVTSKEREEALLAYDIEMYEVVRCKVSMTGRTVSGLKISVGWIFVLMSRNGPLAIFTCGLPGERSPPVIAACTYF